MKILYVAHTTDWHGSSIALFNLIFELRDRHEIHVLVPKDRGLLCDKLKEIGVTIHSFNYRMHIFNSNSNIIQKVIQISKAIYVNRMAKSKFEDLLRRLLPDLVHCNIGPLSFTSELCADKRIPHIWHVREYQDRDFGFHYIPSKHSFIKTLSHPNNTVIAITRDIFRYWGLDPKKDKVIYDGVFSQTIPLPARTPHKQFLFVGRVAESKGTLEVIKAFDEFSNDNKEYILLIAGAFFPDRHTYAKECQDYVKSRSLENKVIFLGECKNVFSLMASSQALIVASRSEGFGFITVEGMVNKTIVIGKDSGGTKEQFDNGKLWSGEEIGLRYNTQQELVKQMTNCIKDKYTSLRQRAFDVVWNHYSIQKHALEIEEVYHQVVKS